MAIIHLFLYDHSAAMKNLFRKIFFYFLDLPQLDFNALLPDDEIL